MLRAKATRTVKKRTIDLISEKTTLHVQNTFFCTFLCRCFARPQRETSRNFLVTSFMEKMSYLLLLTFFFTGLFSPCRCRYDFSFSHRHFKIFMLFFQQIAPYLPLQLSVALFLAGLPPTLFFLYIPKLPLSVFVFIDSLQLSLLHKTRVVMGFPAEITRSCIWVALPNA